MKYYTLVELRSRLKHGDWLIPEGKSVAIQVNLYDGSDSVELCEDWAKSYPSYRWDYKGKFAYIPKEAIDEATSV